MDKFYSYTDFLRAIGHTSRENNAEKLLNEIYLDLFLQRLQREHRLETLMHLIDESLCERDKEQFMVYTKEYMELQQDEYQ